MPNQLFGWLTMKAIAQMGLGLIKPQQRTRERNCGRHSLCLSLQTLTIFKESNVVQPSHDVTHKRGLRMSEREDLSLNLVQGNANFIDIQLLPWILIGFITRDSFSVRKYEIINYQYSICKYIHYAKLHSTFEYRENKTKAFP